MRRLIDADKLKECILEQSRICDNDTIIASLSQIIDEQSPVDAVEVVRCRDCQHKRYDAVYLCYWCSIVGRHVTIKSDHYCKFGDSLE